MSRPYEMPRISSGEDRACALRARAHSAVGKGDPLPPTAATARQRRAYFAASIERRAGKT
jgi:hypothetical protein